MLTISEDQLASLHSEGYMMLESVIGVAQLETLRTELDKLIIKTDEAMAAKGVEAEGLNHRGKRYFIGGGHVTSEGIREFIFSDLTADICRATLGPDAFFFLEQFVVKTAEVGMN